MPQAQFLTCLKPAYRSYLWVFAGLLSLLGASPGLLSGPLDLGMWTREAREGDLGKGAGSSRMRKVVLSAQNPVLELGWSRGGEKILYVHTDALR